MVPGHRGRAEVPRWARVGHHHPFTCYDVEDSDTLLEAPQKVGARAQAGRLRQLPAPDH